MERKNKEKIIAEKKILSKYIIPIPDSDIDHFFYLGQISDKDFVKAGKELKYWKYENKVFSYLYSYNKFASIDDDDIFDLFLKNKSRYINEFIKFDSIKSLLDCMQAIKTEFEQLDKSLLSNKPYIENNLTDEQIKYLCKELNDKQIFNGTLEQWRNVFSVDVKERKETIQVLIQAEYLYLLFELLKQNNLISTSLAISFYVIEEYKLFSNQNNTIYDRHLINNNSVKRQKRAGQKPLNENNNTKQKEDNYIRLEEIIKNLSTIK